jgi:hypothetical protein
MGRTSVRPFRVGKLSVWVIPIVIGSEQLFKDEENDEHFALLSAGCASQEKFNPSTGSGQ